MPPRLQGRIALVTGAGSPTGIGFATARVLGREGATLAITSTTDRIREREAELREAGYTAAGFVQLDRPEDVAKVAPIDERTFVVVMTHNFLRDKDYVRSLLGSPARFVAMLGPGARTERLLTELRDEGTQVSNKDLGRIHGPAGLDVGAEGPEEIAAAIVAEIVAVKRGREGGFLKHRHGPIHDRGSAVGHAP